MWKVDQTRSMKLTEGPADVPGAAGAAGARPTKLRKRFQMLGLLVAGPATAGDVAGPIPARERRRSQMPTWTVEARADGPGTTVGRNVSAPRADGVAAT